MREYFCDFWYLGWVKDIVQVDTTGVMKDWMFPVTVRKLWRGGRLLFRFLWSAALAKCIGWAISESRTWKSVSARWGAEFATDIGMRLQIPNISHIYNLRLRKFIELEKPWFAVRLMPRTPRSEPSEAGSQQIVGDCNQNPKVLPTASALLYINATNSKHDRIYFKLLDIQLCIV